MKRLLFPTAILFVAAAHACAGEQFLASVLAVGERQNLRRTTSTDPAPVRRTETGDRVASVSLKLPSLGDRKEGKMRVVEIEGADDGSLTFDLSRSGPSAPDIGIPGLVSPEILALDQYNFRAAEPSSPKTIAPSETSETSETSEASEPTTAASASVRASTATANPGSGDNLHRRDSLQSERVRPAVHYTRVEIPSAPPAGSIERPPAPNPPFAPGSLKPPPSPAETPLRSLTPPLVGEFSEPKPQAPIGPGFSEVDHDAFAHELFPMVPAFEWPPPEPYSPAAVEQTRVDIPVDAARMRGEPIWDASATPPPAVDEHGFTSMREFRNVLAPIYRNAESGKR